MARSEGDASSRGDADSGTSSQHEARDTIKKRRNAGGGEEDDLTEQNKTLQEAIHQSMYTLARSRSADDWRLAGLKCVLEALVPFLVVFNPTMLWPINTGNPVWQVVRWALPRSPVARIWGYDTYILLFYVLVGLIGGVLAAVAALTFLMRRQEQSRWLRRFAMFIQKFTDVIFGMLYVSIFDYITFLFNCHWGAHDRRHDYWPEVACMSGSHLATLAVAAVTAVVFFLSTGLMLVAGCELSPTSRGLMASPAALVRLQVLLVKAVFVIAANTLGSLPKIQAIVLVVCVGAICYLNFYSLPFMRRAINCIWIGGWVAVFFTTMVHVVWKWAPHHLEHSVSDTYMLAVLVGVWPAAAVGAALTAVWWRWRMRPLVKFRAADVLQPGAKLKKIYKFDSPEEVELLARGMRHWDSDGVILEDAAQLGEMVIKCGLATFPGDVGLLILHANFLMEVKRDGPAARTQLQLALKGGPSMIQRYQIFSTIENSKRLKDGQSGQLDLQSYVEFKRNYRAVIRVHKAALAAQRDFWTLLLGKSHLTMAQVAAALDGVEAAAGTAHQVYKRVLERYPANGKLLRCYGKFLEDVRHDTAAAVQAYTEAARHGGGDGLLSLDLKIEGSDKPEFLTSMDLHEDACMVINHEGTILMVNSCVTPLLGYLKAELEGANVSMIMPQPFAGRHAGYMQRYVQGGEPHILDTVRDVVALHKDRFVFPLQLCVTKLSGIGTDSIFLGVLRPVPLDARNVRAWVAPNGLILCTDPQFASLTGLSSGDMVGRHFQSLVTDMGACESLLEACKDAPFESLAAGLLVAPLRLAHKYLPPVPVEIRVSPSGTDAQRLFVFNARRTDGNSDGLMVVDTKGALTFATWDVAAMLGYPLKRFLTMRLEQLLPQPFAAMHAKHLKDVPATIAPTSCRAGRVVPLLNSKGAQVPVRLRVASQDDAGTGRMQHVVQVAKVDASSPADLYGASRLVLTCTMDGRITGVDPPGSTVFGFTAGGLVGSNLADCIDVFGEWRDRAGAHQMELLLLSLLDREAEMPGTSWRVLVHGPLNELESLPNIGKGAAPRRATGVRACLQSELVEALEEEQEQGQEQGQGQGQGQGQDAGGFVYAAPVAIAGAGAGAATAAAAAAAAPAVKIRARIVLWRRDLLCGVVELDDKLVVRRADMDTGLIVGLPPASLARMPLHRLLDVPPGAKWEEIMAADAKAGGKGGRKDGGGGGGGGGAQRSALKGGTGAVTVWGPKAFIGAHPDCGTMRISVQGVTGAGAGGRISATLHPDTTYVGARANVYRALGLEALMGQQAGQQQGGEQQEQEQQQQKQQKQLVHSNSSSASGDDREVGGPARKPRATQRRRQKQQRASEEVREGSSEERGEQEEQEQEQEDADGIGFGTRSNVGSGSVSDGGLGEQQGGADDVDAPAAAAAAAAGAAIPAGAGRRGSAAGDAADETAAGSDAHLHQRAASQSAFVASWVRNVSRQASRQLAASAAAAPAAAGNSGGGGWPLNGPHQDGSGGGSALRTRASSDRLAVRYSSGLEGAAGSGGAAVRSMGQRSPAELSMGVVAEVEVLQDSQQGGGGAEEEEREDGGGGRKGNPQRRGSGGAGSSDNDAASSANDDDDDAMSASGGHGGGLSDGGSVADVDIAVDARRARLLKRLLKVLGGPSLALPLERLRFRSLVVLGVMVAVHVVCYVVLQGLIAEQFTNVRELHRLALAADRCQVATVKAAVAEFCSRPGVAPVSVCEIPLNRTVSDIRSALEDLESYHQSVFLGLTKTPQPPGDPSLMRVWQSHVHEYTFPMDTVPPGRALNFTSGLWQLGNRFIAAGRELLFWAEDLSGRIGGLRSYAFVLSNGPWALFTAYTQALDYLATHAWNDIASLQTGCIILLVVEAAGLQLACIAYQWWLVRGVEGARRGDMLTGLALPGPVLRSLAHRPLVVLEDSDDEDAEDEDEDGGGGGGGGGGARDGGGRRRSVEGTAPDGHHHNHDGQNQHQHQHQRNNRSSIDFMPPPPPPGGASVAATPGAAGAASGSRSAASGAAHAAAARLRHMDSSAGSGLEEDGGGGGGEDWAAAFMQHGAVGQDSERVAALGDFLNRGGGGGGMKRAVLRPEGRFGVRVNHKVLRSSPHGQLRFMVPLALWELALVAVFVVSFLRLEGLQGPLASLNMSTHVIYRYTRVRMSSLLLVAGSEPAERAHWRSVLAAEVANLENEYDTLMYGGVAASQVAQGIFLHPVPASTFESASFAYNFFREEKCFRWDPSKCYSPESPYYELTHHGLDPMVRRIITEMQLLVADDDSDAVYNGTRYVLMYQVGIRDMYEGLQTSAQLFVDFMLSRFDSIKLLHTILLIATICLAVLYAAFVPRPYAAGTEREAGTLAGLLSHVPPEACDVLALAKQVIRSHEQLMSSSNSAKRRGAGAGGEEEDGGGGGGDGPSNYSHHGSGGFFGRRNNKMVNGKV
ncbi:hypothetical protein HYH02_013949 [Chlamydomonas schloesseri]|uniref:PAS domain-containing protein n=1 Tax=Chlamydomonas schloesseri TaxID=2026947 RepID=A0A835SQ01_9CHLO|nr:hypothetical protein HYH02_013949 [Chlamydomonas schloesseri]|eukprot:KAG2429691.1 hypothetical protein HYH02_013949 [Chlamydomonas schloesseri]